jgi:hypothetical protein
MSEYQYYEFRAIDRPLSAQAMKELRALSSRADITPTSFSNEYNYGSFRGNDLDVLAEYFDAFLYVANWGTHRLAFRFPAALIDVDAFQDYCEDEFVTLQVRGEYALLDMNIHLEEGGDWEEGEGWLEDLVSLRADLLAGDLRCLYLAWLAGVQYSDPEQRGDEVEPPVPPGLGQLTPTLKKFAEFIWLDEDLLASAAEGSGAGAAKAGPSREELAAWIARQPEARKNEWLLAVTEDEAPAARMEMLREFRQAWARNKPKGKPDEADRRTVAELLGGEEVRAEERRQRQAEEEERERRQQAEEKERARKARLDGMAGREVSLWRAVEKAIDSKKPKEYDWAVELIGDLLALAEREGKRAQVLERVREVRKRHQGKRSFLERMDRAGLTG